MTSGPTTQQPDPLPQSQILSYVTNLNSPTRVRRVAAWGVGVSALFYASLVPFTSIEELTLLAIPVESWIRGKPLSSVMGEFSYLLDRLWPFLLIPAELLFLVLCQTALVISVARGRKFACRIAWWTMIPAVLVAAWYALSYSTYAIAWGFSFGHLHGDPFEFFWLLPAFGFVIGSLIFRDWIVMLRWVARQPNAEKPKIPFLPK